MKLGVTEYVDCAHFLPGHPKCGRLHGHTYKVEVTIEGQPKDGMIIDFADLKQTLRDALTHECDYPPEASSKLKITDNVIDHERMTSAQIDHHVASNIGRHGSIYALKEDLLERLQPDLIVTQELCDVCAVSYKQVQQAAKVLEGR